MRLLSMSSALRCDDLRHAQAGAIGHAERSPVLDARRRLEQLRHLLDAQHVRQLARVAGQHQPPRQIRPVERHREQETQRRHRAVDGRRARPAVALMQLEPADVFGRRRVGRSPQEGRKTTDVADIVTPGMLAQAAHRHVIEHPLAKRGYGPVAGLDSHGELPLVGRNSIVGGLPCRAKPQCRRTTSLNRPGFAGGPNS